MAVNQCCRCRLCDVFQDKLMKTSQPVVIQLLRENWSQLRQVVSLVHVSFHFASVLSSISFFLHTSAMRTSYCGIYKQCPLTGQRGANPKDNFSMVPYYCWIGSNVQGGFANSFNCALVLKNLKSKSLSMLEKLKRWLYWLLQIVLYHPWAEVGVT